MHHCIRFRFQTHASTAIDWYLSQMFGIKIVYKKTDEWYIKWQRATTSDNAWPRLILLFFQIRKESTTKNPMENSLNLQEDLEERYWIKSWRKPLRKIWIVRSRNDRSSCLQIFLKIGALKIFAISTGKNLCWSLF